MELCCGLQTRVMACGICKNYIHESCFAEWKKQKKGLKQDVTCVYCRCAQPPCTASLSVTASSKTTLLLHGLTATQNSCIQMDELDARCDLCGVIYI